jgi:hypothetical protein
MMRPWLMVIACGLAACSTSDAAERVGCDLHPPGETHLEDCAVRDPDGGLTVSRDALGRVPFGDDAATALWIEQELYFVHRTGRTAPAFFFDNGADPFVEGLARTFRNGSVGFVNSELVEVVEARWDFAEPFAGGFARVCDGCRQERRGEHSVLVGGRWGVVDGTGHVVVPVVHDRESIPAPPAPGR